jgi:hypothetical protein
MLALEVSQGPGRPVAHDHSTLIHGYCDGGAIRSDTYALSRDNRMDIETFGAFADQPMFLALPSDPRGSLNTWWTRAWSDAKSRL